MDLFVHLFLCIKMENMGLKLIRLRLKGEILITYRILITNRNTNHCNRDTNHYIINDNYDPIPRQVLIQP